MKMVIKRSNKAVNTFEHKLIKEHVDDMTIDFEYTSAIENIERK